MHICKVLVWLCKHMEFDFFFLAGQFSAPKRNRYELEAPPNNFNYNFNIQSSTNVRSILFPKKNKKIPEKINNREIDEEKEKMIGQTIMILRSS